MDTGSNRGSCINRWAAGLAIVIAILLIACQGAATPAPTQLQPALAPSPTPGFTAATLAPQPTAHPASVPTPTAAPTASLTPTPAATGAPPTPAPLPPTPTPTVATPTPVSPRAEDPPREVVVAIGPGSMARYRVREQFARVTLPNDAVGETSDVTGSIFFDAKGAVQADRSKITVNLRTLRSDESDRDDYLRTESLETDQFQQTEFVVEATPGLPWPLPKEGLVAFQLQGSMTVRAVTSPTTWEVTARFGSGGVEGQGKTSFTFDKFRMKRPSAFFLISVENNIRLELDFVASIQPQG